MFAGNCPANSSAFFQTAVVGILLHTYTQTLSLKGFLFLNDDLAMSDEHRQYLFGLHRLQLSVHILLQIADLEYCALVVLVAVWLVGFVAVLENGVRQELGRCRSFFDAYQGLHEFCPLLAVALDAN